MNPQELFIDVSSGRFLDGESTIPVARPSIYSDEQKTLDVSVLRVKNNVVRKWNPSAKSKYKIRLGTAEHKLADGIEPTTTPPQLFTATGIVVTKPSFGVKGTGTVYTYSPVTATFVANLTPTAGVTANIDLSIYNPTKVTASIDLSIYNPTKVTANIDLLIYNPPKITASITASVGATISTQSIVRPLVGNRSVQSVIGQDGRPTGEVIISYPPNEVPVDGKINPELIDRNTMYGSGLQGMPLGALLTLGGGKQYVCSFQAVLGGGTAASASAFIENGVLTATSLGSRGSGYSGLFAQVVVSGGRNPTAATFNVTISGGSVVSISIATAGSGYLSGSYDVVFDSGDATATATASLGKITSVILTSGGTGYAVTPGALVATASSVTATVSASVLNGFVDTLTITCAGSGYTTAPTLVFTSPRQSVSDIIPSNQVGIVGGKRRFMWVYGVDTTRTEAQIRQGIPEEVLPPTNLRFSNPAQSVLDNIPTSVPSATVRFVREDPRNNIWEIDLISGGYGYTSAPTVTHDPAVCSTAKLKIRKYLFISEATRQIVFPGLAGLPPEADQTNAFEIVLDRKTRTEIRNGGTFRDYTTTNKFLEIANSRKNIFAYGSDRWRGELTYQQMKAVTDSIYYSGIGRDPLRPWKYAFAIEGQDESTRIVADVSENDVFVVYEIKDGDPETIKQFFTTIYPSNDQRGLKVGIGRGAESPGQNGSFYTQAVFPKHDTFIGVPIYANIFNQPSAYSPDRITDASLKSYAGYSGNFMYRSVGTIKSGTNGNQAVIALRGASKRTDYKVHFVSNTFLTSGFTDRRIMASVDGGGVFEGEVEFLDYGDGCLQDGETGQADLLRNQKAGGQFGLRTDVPFYVGSFGQTLAISVATPAGTILAQEATIVTQPLASGVGYFFGTSGYGYGSYLMPSKMVITISVITAVTGFLKDVRLLNAPAGYSAGDFQCEIAAPPSGTTASVILRQSGGSYSVVLLEGGSGYVTAPIITAPAPDIIYGNVVEARVTNSPEGYFEGNTYFCQVGQSPLVGGDAVISLQKDSQNRYSAQIINPGFGYTSAPVVTAPAPDVVYGNVVEAQIANSPEGYFAERTYFCQVGQSPVSGGDATISFQKSSQGQYTARIINPGYGYTSAPVVTAPAPDVVYGNVVNARVTNSPEGYSENKIYFCQVGQSPVVGGNAEIVLQKDSQGRYSAIINNPGYGYTSAPVVTAPGFDPANLGKIKSIALSNTPVGYVPNQSFNLEIGSPTTGTTALGKVDVVNGRFTAQVLAAGFGYLTPPTITGIAPNADQGVIVGATVTCVGSGYAPGSYEITFDSPPTNGVKATGVAIIDQFNTRIEIQSGGRGYTSQPSLSVPTPAGSAVSEITITCKGNFYIPVNANITLSDATGVGAILAQPQVLGGQIEAVNVLNSGYGYSNPKVVFTSPTAPDVEAVPPNKVIVEVNITTASANTILGTASQKDVLLEVYETDGIDEQVVAQGTMSLAKRVKE